MASTKYLKGISLLLKISDNGYLQSSIKKELDEAIELLSDIESTSVAKDNVSPLLVPTFSSVRSKDRESFWINTEEIKIALIRDIDSIEASISWQSNEFTKFLRQNAGHYEGIWIRSSEMLEVSLGELYVKGVRDIDNKEIVTNKYRYQNTREAKRDIYAFVMLLILKITQFRLFKETHGLVSLEDIKKDYGIEILGAS